MLNNCSTAEHIPVVMPRHEASAQDYPCEAELKLAYIKLFRKELEEEWKKYYQ